MALDPDRVLVTGGRAASGDLADAYVVNVADGTLAGLPDMSVSRVGHSCGVVTSGGVRRAVVAGGITGSGRHDEVEYLVLDGGEGDGWRPLDPLPRHAVFAASVPLGSTFAAVGGSLEGQAEVYDTVLEFDVASLRFVERSERLIDARYGFGAVLVDDQFTSC